MALISVYLSSMQRPKTKPLQVSHIDCVGAHGLAYFTREPKLGTHFCRDDLGFTLGFGI